MRSLRRGQNFRVKADSVGKPRPVLIVSPAQLNAGIYVNAIPFYSQQLEKRRSQAWCVFFRAGEFGLETDCVAKADEVSQFKISELRISDGEVGHLDTPRLALIDKALCYALGIEIVSQQSDREKIP